jgi:VWFA-related protein
MTRWSAACLAIALLPASTARAQAPESPPPIVVEADVQMVAVTAVVFDKGGHFVRGLTPKDIQVLEDGVPQEVTIFREARGGEEQIPLSVALVLDTSGSMKESLTFLQEAATSFVYKFDEVDQTLVVSFNETIKGSSDFSDDLDRAERFINGLQAWGGTSLYDAIDYSLLRIKDRSGRKAVVVFSDGADTTSALDSKAVIERAKAVEATIYGIAFKGNNPGLGGGSAKGLLTKLADETGGEVYSPDKVGDLRKVFSAIADELRNHYLLAYAPAREADNSWRKLDVKIARPGVEVRVRKGYVAAKRRKRR